MQGPLFRLKYDKLHVYFKESQSKQRVIWVPGNMYDIQIIYLNSSTCLITPYDHLVLLTAACYSTYPSHWSMNNPLQQDSKLDFALCSGVCTL